MAEGHEYHLGGHHQALDYHGGLLADSVRMVAYERAIRECIAPGDVVLDLGTGTGVLAMLVARRGARVHAVESAAVVGVARDLVLRNGLSDRVTVHHGDIRDLPIAEPVDWVIGEFMGRFLIDDGMLGAVESAGRWLKPGGRFLPAQIRLMLAPVYAPVPAVSVFQSRLFGLDLTPAVRYAVNTCYASLVAPNALLADGQLFHTFDPPARAPVFDRTLEFTLGWPGWLTAFAGWFEADLSPSVTLCTGPGHYTHWGQYLFPLEPVEVREGDVLSVHLRLVPPLDDPGWAWTGTLSRSGEVVATFDLESEQRLGEREAQIEPLSPVGDRVAVLARSDLGTQYFHEQKLLDALNAYEEAVRGLGPDLDDRARALYENLGLARFNLQLYAEAARAMLRALDGEPEKHQQALDILIRSLHAQGLVQDALRHVADYRRAFGKHPLDSRL